MASPTTPTHGRYGALYRLRSNGFKGQGLNDLTWASTYATASDSSYFEIVIDHENTPDTFKWRENGGAWTEDVAITGAAQTLDGANGDPTVTFAAVTGHTAGDQWSAGFLYAEPTTEATNTAQITDTAFRLLRPDATITWTDSGGKTVTTVSYAEGKAYFNGNVANVTVAGNNAIALESGLEKVGYLQDVSLTISMDMADISSMGDYWKTALPGMGSATGTANGFFIGMDSFFHDLKQSVTDGTQRFFLLQMFNYDPDQDQTGDHFNMWVTFTSDAISATVGEAVKETVNFQVHGHPVFVSNV